MQRSDKKSEGLQEFVGPGMSLEEVTRMKECFDIFDSDGSGSISPEELRNAIVALGMEKQAQKILALVANYTKECGSDDIDFGGFMKLFGFNSDLKDKGRQENVFKQFDLEGKGYVTVEDFMRVSELCGERYTEAELRKMVEHAARKDKERLTYEEFTAVLQKDFPKK